MMKSLPSKKSPQFNQIGTFDMPFDYGIASALKTVRTYPVEPDKPCMHLEDNDAF
jgi:hypothetical protein